MPSVITTPKSGESTYKDKSYGFGYYESQGPRPTMEDTLAWHTLSNDELAPQESLVPLTPVQIGRRLWTTCHELNEGFLKTKTPAGEHVGSTATTTVYDGRGNLITATLGDANTFAAVYNKKGDVLGVIRLNTIVHKPDDEQEKARIRAAGEEIYYFGVARVKGLAISRSLGDASAKPLVSADAHIDITHIAKIAKDLKIEQQNIGSFQVISTCDGFTDGAGDTKQSKEDHEHYLFDTLKTIKNPGKHSEELLCKQLVNRALENGSFDNVTVTAQTITPLSEAFLLGVYDGHGGDQAAVYAAQHVGSIFKEQCKRTEEEYSEHDLSVQSKAECYFRDNKEVDAEYLQNCSSELIIDKEKLTKYHEQFNEVYSKQGWYATFFNHKTDSSQRTHTVKDIFRNIGKKLLTDGDTQKLSLKV
jgi:serine/threonine protein phosphatase PrpC